MGKENLERNNQNRVGSVETEASLNQLEELETLKGLNSESGTFESLDLWIQI